MRSRLQSIARKFDPRRRALPTFLIVGAQKSGTSTLYANLAAHPSVAPGVRKEVHYFDYPPRGERWYRSQFPLESRGVTGEASPYYLFHPGVPQRVREMLPDVRLIAVLRDPVERAVSGYYHAVRAGREHRPIDVALDPCNTEELPSDLAWYDSPQCPARLAGYLVRGHYAEQLERWFSHFGRSQMLVIKTASLNDGMAEVLEFLDLPLASTQNGNRGRASYPSPPDAVTQSLREYFEPHNRRLFDLLDVDWPWPT
jgi:hypothetical protein